MALKPIHATFYLTKDNLYKAAIDPVTHAYRTYFCLAGHLDDTVSYNLHMYNLVGEGDIFHVVLKVTGSPVFVSGVFHVNYNPCFGSEAGHIIEKKMCSPEEQLDILSASYYSLFNNRATVDISIDLVLQRTPGKSVIALPCPAACEIAEPDTFDVDFLVEGVKVPAHLGFLSMISPVFRAMFTHDTKEAQTGTIEITDFDLATVTNVMNFCYGDDTGLKSVSEVLSIARFADKYDLQTVIKFCDEALCTQITTENFCQIADYLWTMDKVEWKPLCIDFFRRNPKIVFTPAFAALSLVVREGIIQEAVVVE